MPLYIGLSLDTHYICSYTLVSHWIPAIYALIHWSLTGYPLYMPLYIGKQPHKVITNNIRYHQCSIEIHTELKPPFNCK